MKKALLTLAVALTLATTMSSCRGGRALPKPPGRPHGPARMSVAPMHP